MPTAKKKTTKPARSRYTGRPVPHRTIPRSKAPKHHVATDELPKPEDLRREMIKLGSTVRDTATDLEGMATHYQIEMNGARFHRFQPRGLSPEDGSPAKGIWLVPGRLQGGVRVGEPDLPTHILGTLVEDMASGFNGIATSICLHISGCVHVSVQPKGKLDKTGGPIEAHDFDIRRLKGAALTPMTETERETDQAAKPSPMEAGRFEPRTPE